MARSRTKRKPAPVEVPIVDRFMAQHGDYREATVVDLSGELGGKKGLAKVVRNLARNKVEEWLLAGGPGFEEPERNAYEHCLSLWEKAGTHGNLIAGYGQRIRCENNGLGWSQHEALSELALYKTRIPSRVWNVFENIARFDYGVGKSAEDMADNPPQRIASAKASVGFVLSLIAMWRGL